MSLKGKIFAKSFSGILLFLGLFCVLISGQGEKIYRTPLAGEEFRISWAGEEIYIPPRDRGEVLALNMGSSFFSPKIADNYAVPFAALYYHKYWAQNRRRLRAVVVGVVNFVDFADGTWNDQGWECLLHWENFTIPFSRAEVLDEKEIEASDIFWGRIVGGFGIGWREKVPPYHHDNAFEAQLFYEPGYLYVRKSDNTGEQVILPPSTVVHQLHLKFRYDSFDRNLLELPHRGWASGLDIKLGRRESWSDHQFSRTITFSRNNTRDFLRITGYAVAAFDVPFLSERHRFLLYAHAGWSRKKNWDRFSAFRIGGGPFSSESEDLERHPFPGALFDQFIVESYAIFTVEYRLEVFFFMFLHIRGTIAWAHLADLDKDSILTVSSGVGQAFSIGITSGFFWDSMVYLEYAYDNGTIRRKDSGHGFLISWSKAF